MSQNGSLMKLKKKRLKFKPHADASSSVDSILLTPEKPIALLAFGHGASAGMEHANMQNIATAFAERRIATFRYNFPFIHRGGGRDSNAVTLQTIRRAVAKARTLLPHVPLLAGGHSFGGRMTTIAQAELPLEIDGLICSSFPLHAPGRVSDDTKSQSEHERQKSLSLTRWPELHRTGLEPTSTSRHERKSKLSPISDRGATFTRTETDSSKRKRADTARSVTLQSGFETKTRLKTNAHNHIASCVHAMKSCI